MKTGRFKLGQFDVREISRNTFYYTSFKIPGTKFFKKALKAIVGFEKCYEPICSANVHSKYKYSKEDCNKCFKKKVIKLFCTGIA